MRRGKLLRIGNSIGFVIPRKTLAKLGWENGDDIRHLIHGEQVIIRNVTPQDGRAGFEARKYAADNRRIT